MDTEFFVRFKPVSSDIGHADLARVQVGLGDRTFSRFYESNTGRVHEWMTTSPVGLALWFADNWWRLRWEPIPASRATPDWRMRHELSSASSGRFWPPLMIYGAGGRMVFAPAGGAPLETGPLRYIDPPVSVCDATEYESGLDAFFAAVRADDAGAADAAILVSLLDQLAAERSDPDAAGWRRLKARLGYDPDDAPEQLMHRLGELEERFGDDAVAEAAVAAPGVQAARVIEQGLTAARESTVAIDVAVARQAQLRIKLSGPPWRQAEDVASKVRHMIGRREGPLRAKPLADALRVRWETVRAAVPTARALPYAVRLRLENADRVQISLQTRSSHDRRFELARALGDAVWDVEATFAPLTRIKTDRQKFSRAFAQSLLCPFEDLRSLVTPEAPAESEIQAAARHFHVNAGVVRTLLVNKGLLPRETLDERLEAA